jgi:AcrR family transcriptional regulator
MENERSLASSRQAGGLPFPARRGTREALLDAALDGFARHGFAGTSIRDLARAVGIRESSVYKHFDSKQAILDALIDRAEERMALWAAQLGATTTTYTGEDAAPVYQGISEEDLTAMARGMLDFVLHGPDFASVRRLMAIEQYHDPEVSDRFHAYFIKQPLAFQADLFRTLFASGAFLDGLDPEQTALAFYGPIYLLIELADGGDEQRALELLAGHVRHFRLTHLKEPG